MAVYEYKALTKSGKNKKGIIDADSEDNAKVKIRENNLYPVFLKEIKEIYFPYFFPFSCFCPPVQGFGCV